MPTCDLHPGQYIVYPPDEECPWCEDLFRLRGQVIALTAQLTKTAVIIKDGDHNLKIDEPIGYLVVNGGSVRLESPCVIVPHYAQVGTAGPSEVDDPEDC